MGAQIDFVCTTSGSIRFPSKDPGEAECSRIPEIHPEIDPEGMIRWLIIGSPPRICTSISNNIRCLTGVVLVPQRSYASHALDSRGPEC
jgi:hypothetical protein